MVSLLKTGALKKAKLMSETSLEIRFRFEPGYENVILPDYQTAGSAGMDVRAAENLILQPGETQLVATGFAMALPVGYEAQLRPRSGLAAKHKITLLNSPGTID